MPEISDRLIQISAQSVAIYWRRYIVIRVKENRIVWARLRPNFSMKAFALFEQRRVNPRRHRNHAVRQLSFSCTGSWARQLSFG